MEGRRHSVDVPISRTLIALRRVKSLRDPSTNSMAKLSALIDSNLNWETNSNNGITLGFQNDAHESYYGQCRSKQASSPLALMPNWSTLDVDNESTSGDCSEVLARENRCEEISVYRNSDACMVEFCHQGCGIGSCWSRATKFREPNVVIPDDEQPLMLGQIPLTRTDVEGEGIVESPRSFCQTFMPKSFDELVGQETVATFLKNATNNRQIASLYLFHGPRGTGKTSASRIFAAALNCLRRRNVGPCGVCEECMLIFSGRCRDVKEVDSVRINRKERRRLLAKTVRIPPVFSRFKVYLIDECHLMHRDTWGVILSCLEELPERVIFVMTTPNLDKVPPSALSKSRKFHFQKVRATDIANVLARICVEERLDYDTDALNFISAKSNGSLRDAEMMLDQLSLLGKKITVSLVHEVNGFVSNNELLDLLHLALSADASNTVKKARELLASRIDPLQLTSQLANLIMDILAGKCPVGVSEVRRKLFGTNNSEADLQQLSYALKILLQTEKHLRTCKNQTTWLTAALLQLSSTGCSYDASEVRLSVRTLEPQDGDFLSTSSTCESLKHCEDVETRKIRMHDEKEELRSVWTRATGICTSSSFRKFLQKHGKIVSIRLNQGIAVAELEFDRPEDVSKAEKSWKMIAGTLQQMLGYNVELRINLAPDKHEEVKKSPFFIRFFNCSRRARSNLSAECRSSNASRNSEATPTTQDRYIKTYSSDGKDLFKTIRSNDGNALSVGTSTPNGSLPNDIESDRGLKGGSKFRCWRNAVFPFRKVRNEQRNEQLMDYALHCASAN